jgi:hypothetical protein
MVANELSMTLVVRRCFHRRQSRKWGPKSAASAAGCKISLAAEEPAIKLDDRDQESWVAFDALVGTLGVNYDRAP